MWIAVPVAAKAKQKFTSAIIQNERVPTAAPTSYPGSLSADPESLFSPRMAGPGRRWGMGLPRARLLAAAAAGTVRLEQNLSRVSAILELPEEHA